MSRHFIVIDDKHRDDGYRRDEMYRRMSGGYRMDSGTHMGNYRNSDYDEGYRTGYEHGFKDHEQDENWRRMRGADGRFM